MVTLTQLTQQQMDFMLSCSQAYKIQDNKTIDRQIINAEELFVKAQYHCSMQVYTNWYWNQHPQQHVITVPTLTTLHTRLEVNTLTDFHAIPKSVCYRTQEKNPYQDSRYV